MQKKLLKNRHLILASASPRRHFFLKELGLEFEIRVKEIEESYPKNLKGHEISEYLSRQKATPFAGELKENDLLITADTIVWFEGKALGKPKDKNEARQMLRSLSDHSHQVISSVAITTSSNQVLTSDLTTVWFKSLSDQEIDFYIDKYKPYDKAGAYGIQEWIGYIGIEKIEGSYFNVMGFPIQKFYQALLEI